MKCQNLFSGETRNVNKQCLLDKPVQKPKCNRWTDRQVNYKMVYATLTLKTHLKGGMGEGRYK